jgi:nitroreductase
MSVHVSPDAPARPLSALDAIFLRRSVRAYAPQPLEEATIRSLLDAAVRAPSAMHAEPWAFVIIQDRATLKRYSDRAKGTWEREADRYRDLHGTVHRGGDTEARREFTERFASPDFCIFYDAPALIVICARPLGPFVTADCWLAAENLMLAATALGLGSCCIGSAVPVLNTSQTKAELGIPVDVEAIVPIVVGVPALPATEPTRKEPEILSWKR